MLISADKLCYCSDSGTWFEAVIGRELRGTPSKSAKVPVTDGDEEEEEEPALVGLTVVVTQQV